MDAQKWSEAERREHEDYWQIAWFAKERNRLRRQQATEQGRIRELIAEMQEEYSWCPHPTAGGFGLFAQNHLGTQQIPTSRLELADWLNGHAEHVEILRQFEQSEHSEESHSGKTLRDAVEIGRAAFGIGSVLFERITGNKPSLSPKLDTAQNCVASIKQLVGLITKLKQLELATNPAKPLRGGTARARPVAKTFMLIELAVRKHHGFNGGIVDGRVAPVSGRPLASQSNGAFSARSVDRWIVNRFGSKAKYESACFDGTLGGLLAVNPHDVSEFRAHGTFDHSEHDITDECDSDDDEHGEDAVRSRDGKNRSRIVRRF